MLNKARPFFTRVMTPAGELLARTPVTPNMVTVTGTVGVAASTLWGYPTGHLFLGALVAYVKARAEGLGVKANVGIAERPERMVTTFVAVGLSGLGVPYILQVGLWGLAAASVVTLAQRMHAVRRNMAALDAEPPAPATQTTHAID